MCVYVQLNHSGICLKLTQHCISTIVQYKMKFFKKACMTMCLFLEEGTLAYHRETFHFGDIDYRVYNNSKFYDNCEDNTFILWSCSYEYKWWYEWLIGFPGASSGEKPACQCRRCRLDPWVWKKAMQPTPAFLTGESNGQGSLVGYSQ